MLFCHDGILPVKHGGTATIYEFITTQARCRRGGGGIHISGMSEHRKRRALGTMTTFGGGYSPFRNRALIFGAVSAIEILVE
jgi:hypothetical protein